MFVMTGVYTVHHLLVPPFVHVISICARCQRKQLDALGAVYANVCGVVMLTLTVDNVEHLLVPPGVHV